MVKTSSRKRRREYKTLQDNESDFEYQVKAILNKRIRGKKIEYLLKWEGYSSEDNTVIY